MFFCFKNVVNLAGSSPLWSQPSLDFRAKTCRAESVLISTKEPHICVHPARAGERLVVLWTRPRVVRRDLHHRRTLTWSRRPTRAMNLSDRSVWAVWRSAKVGCRRLWSFYGFSMIRTTIQFQHPCRCEWFYPISRGSIQHWVWI